MFKPLTGPVGHLLRSSPGYRVVSSAAATVTNNETIAADYDLARPYKEMPKITFLTMMWDSFKDPTVKLKMDMWFDGFFTKCGGSIYRVWIPRIFRRSWLRMVNIPSKTFLTSGFTTGVGHFKLDNLI